MNVNLGPVFDQFVGKLLATGLYQSQSEILREGLRLLKEREDNKLIRIAELRKELAIGIKEADEGRFIDGEAALKALRKKSSARKAG